MKMTTGITDLELTVLQGGTPNVYHAALLADDDGLTLIDAGLPGMLGQIEEKIRAAGYNPDDVRRIVFTHQDVDHIGALAQLLERLPGVEILVHADERPYLEGEQALIKMPAERLQSMPDGLRRLAEQMLASLVPGRVTRVLQHGEELPLQGGLRILHTPGHTPGHISLYVPGEKLLLAGDALRVENGALAGPSEPYTPDMNQALRSLEQLAELEIDRVLCYHGGLYEGDVRGALQKITGVKS
ncbi:MBL fold metallo-hydrolase [Saccharibacillus sp. CPCC 101409]|uniref:MBL fold metallo-hydrolase n=1 Tax=Saccharibacillus sp. CPCC 101409 TaxID=3058041 RepID=UPI002673E03C|nr:MBL fold metallo-hydrolase [Saccharibacillus sp. CPCC 101409]MDO3408702.1 MBL fold metallo-hydrolase [Saccharibacillus sp. CPCC 101409]